MPFYETLLPRLISLFFFFNDTATTEIYTLSLHDALPISLEIIATFFLGLAYFLTGNYRQVVSYLRKNIEGLVGDRKSTRLNSSHSQISYAVFCLKKKKI